MSGTAQWINRYNREAECQGTPVTALHHLTRIEVWYPLGYINAIRLEIQSRGFSEG